MRNVIIIVALLFTFTGVYGQSKADRKLRKQEKKEKGYAKIKEIVENKQFEFEALWAIPQAGTRINLITNRGFLQQDEEQVNLFFPFFGQTHIVTNNLGKVSYDYTGTWIDYKEEYEDDNYEIRLTANVEKDGERMEYVLKVGYSGIATLIITSSHRDRMRYEGELKRYVPEEK